MKRSCAFFLARPGLLRPRRTHCARHRRAIASTVPVVSGVSVTMPAALARAAIPLEHNALAPAGIQAEHIVRLWHLTLVVCGIVFAAVLVGVLFALLRRRTAQHPQPPDLSGNVKPERRTQRAVVGVSVLSVVLLVGLVVADVLTDRALSKLPVADALHIQLTGWQWWWQARYPADHGRPAFATANELHVPVGRPVVVMDPENRADAMNDAQKLALTGLITAILDTPGATSAAVLVELRGRKNGATAVGVSMDISLPEGRRTMHLAPYYLTLKTAFEGLSWSEGRLMHMHFEGSRDPGESGTA